MLVRDQLQSGLSKTSLKWAAFLKERRGVAAIEFALIAPLLLSMYFVTMEVAQGIETNKKVARVGSLVADLVTQQQEITKTELEAVMTIGESILQPYNRSKPKVVVTAIEITNDTPPQVRVFWSRKLVEGAFSPDAAKGSTTTVPEKLRVRGSFLVRVESSMAYEPVITWGASKASIGLAAAFDGINMGETYYLRPRMSQSIGCKDC